ncbi:MAG TPA: DUF4215 domain-containing protein [Nannocystaceae bacterium]|nr:DUF4215 domain-containing protein [Nannocystaceae bacterium]
MNQRTTLAWLLPLSLLSGCFSPEGDDDTTLTSVGETSSGSTTDDTLTTTIADTGTTSDSTTMSTSGMDSTGPSDESTGSDESTESTTTEAESESSTGPGSFCGDGIVDEGEACDDMNDDDTDDCVACAAAACGDGFVQAGVESCDDGNADDTDACVSGCVAASCGDGFVLAGTEDCDDANGNDNDACLGSCVAASCGDGVVYEGVEQCDGAGSCDESCNVYCTNEGGGALMAENGVGEDVWYCYEAADTVETRALKACESHFGIGTCCLIPEGYSGLQYGQCGAGGYAGTIHWHPDSHPDGHCDPLYVVGDVVTPGWCGSVSGNFLD